MEEEYEDFGPSKSQRKRDAEELRRLGRTLVELAPDRLARVPLPEQLADAIELARRIKAHGGRRRQIQLIGKLMRQIDVEPIREALAHMERESAATTAQHHELEAWRERMLAEGDEAVAEFLSIHPEAEVQKLRHLVRQAKRERGTGQPPRHSRELFRFLREAMGQR